jgi:hypothetical protein
MPDVDEERDLAGGVEAEELPRELLARLRSSCSMPASLVATMPLS